MIKAEVVCACLINGHPKKPGDIVEVDENTFHNLIRKKVLKAETAKAVKVVDAKALVETIGSQKAAKEWLESAGGTETVPPASPKSNRKKHARG